MNIEKLTVKQICNCVAVINKMIEEKIIKFNPNKACVQFNYDKATRYLEEQNIKQQKQLKIYENMRKEAIEYIEDVMELTKECPQDLLNILNKVGEDNENNN